VGWAVDKLKSSCHYVMSQKCDMFWFYYSSSFLVNVSARFVNAFHCWYGTQIIYSVFAVIIKSCPW